MFSVEVARSAAESDTPPRWLRLIRGSSAQTTPELRGPFLLGRPFSVGSAPACDWAIDGADLPPVALWLRVLAGSLFVRAASGALVHVDGHELGSLWTPIEQGARVSLGEACFEVGLSGRSRAAQRANLPRTFARVPDWFEAPCAPSYEGGPGQRSSQDGAAPFTTGVWALEPEPPALATIFGVDGQRSSLAPRAAGHRLGASALIAGGLLACAYGCWVLLLERL